MVHWTSSNVLQVLTEGALRRAVRESKSALVNIHINIWDAEVLRATVAVSVNLIIRGRAAGQK